MQEIISNSISLSLLGRLRNPEYGQCFKVIVRTIDENNSDIGEDELFHEVASKLKDNLDPLIYIMSDSLKQALTKVISNLHERRIKEFRSFRTLVTGFLKSTHESKASSAEYIYETLMRRGMKMALGTQFHFSEFIEYLKHDYEKDEQFSSAIKDLGIDYSYTSLMEANGQYQENFTSRGVRWSRKKNPIIDTLKIRVAAHADLANFVRYIEFDKKHNDTDKYDRLLFSLRKNLTTYYNTVLSRSTRSAKNGINEQEEVVEYLGNGEGVISQEEKPIPVYALSESDVLIQEEDDNANKLSA